MALRRSGPLGAAAADCNRGGACESMPGGPEAVMLNLFQHPEWKRLAGGGLDPETSSG